MKGIKNYLILLDEEEAFAVDKAPNVINKLILYTVLKNPPIPELLNSKDNKGFIDKEGNLYFIVPDNLEENDEITYTMLLKTLMSNGVFKDEMAMRQVQNQGFSEEGILVQRGQNRKQIAIPDSVDADMVKKYDEEIQFLFKKCGEKNKEYEFVLTNVDNLKVNDEESNNG